jgi:hypothetical protein
MSTTTDLQAFTNKVYLVIKGRYFDDLTSDDGINLINQTIDWANMFIDELETETDAAGQPVDWNFARSTSENLGKARLGKSTVDFDSSFNNLIAESGRYVQVTVGGQVVSNFSVVAPAQITNRADRATNDMVSLVGNTLIFSRPFRDFENGGTITGDVTVPIPRISLTDVSVLNGDNAITPQQLLILGTAKNASLPDIVQGGLSPSYAQRYNDLLDNAKARNSTSSHPDIITRDDLSYISGVGF